MAKQAQFTNNKILFEKNIDFPELPGVYKFFNSLFLGTSIGSIFIIYSPLEPAIYSVGGIVLAFGLMAVASFYEKILKSECKVSLR